MALQSEPRVPDLSSKAPAGEAGIALVEANEPDPCANPDSEASTQEGFEVNGEPSSSTIDGTEVSSDLVPNNPETQGIPPPQQSHSQIPYDLIGNCRKVEEYDVAAGWKLKDAIDALRPLMEHDPNAHEPVMSNLLLRYAAHFILIDRNADALEPGNESASILHRLAQKDPELYEPSLAMLLDNLTVSYESLGELEEAIRTISKSIDVRRRLAKRDPQAFRPLLANSLAQHAVLLSNFDRVMESFVPGLEALVIRRGLSRSYPSSESAAAAYATSLESVAYDLSYCGRTEEVKLLETLILYSCRGMAAKEPKVFEPTLAQCLDQRVMSLSVAGQYYGALETGREALAVRRKLAEKDAEKYKALLAGTLYQYAQDLGKVGRYEDALKYGREALDIRRSLAVGEPGKHDDHIAWSLYNIAQHLVYSRRDDDAVEYYKEAAEIWRRITPKMDQQEPREQEPKVADNVLGGQSVFRQALESYAVCLSNVCKYEVAVAVGREAVAVCRALAQAMVAPQHEELLAMHLHMLAYDLNCCGKNEEAVDAVAEAIAIRRRLAEGNAFKYEHSLSSSLNQHAWYLMHCPGREREALEPAQESVAIYHRLREGNWRWHRFTEALANSMDTVSQVFYKLGEYEEAMRWIKDAIQVFGTLMDAGWANIEDYDHVGGVLKYTYARVLWKVGRAEEAVKAGEGAVVIYRRLVERSHAGRYDRDLADCVALLEMMSSDEQAYLSKPPASSEPVEGEVK
ncbi:hypothetical protein FA15DRAFT_672105 [Coprinopsis marcescibilis]|uniref:Uncharacterized protein n=1 Tax=Coprinopsis marcescibilis TaxID=230819 RepID=A0A5C3KN91_COPMA|nr:hypothetical protein FA15DRAFT_672105 [Coprinopsis marcescibilis]